MFEPRDIAEKKFNAETHNIVGAVLLHRYGKVLENYSSQIDSFRQKLQNNLNVRLNPFKLENCVTESVSLLQLVHSDNKLLSRIIVSLASVCEEIHLLVKEAQTDFYAALICDEEENRKSGDISKTLETFQKIILFIGRSQQVIVLLLKQLCAILGKSVITGNNTSFPEPLDCLAELLVCLLILDSLLESPTLKENFNVYRRTIRSMLHNSSKFNISRDRLSSLDAHLSEIQKVLFTGTVLKGTIEKCLNQQLLVVLKSCSLQTELTNFTHHMLVELERDDENVSFTQILLQVNVVYALECHVYGNVDKKVSKRLLDVNKRVSACTLYGNVLWYPEQFLTKHLPGLCKNLDVKALATNRQTLITSKTSNLQKEAHTLSVQACHWMLEVENLNDRNLGQLNGRFLQERCDTLIDGVKLVKKASELVKWIVNLHADRGRPMTVTVVVEICRLIEILKSVQYVFGNNSKPLVYITLLICQHLTHKALLLIHNVKKSFKQEKSYKAQQLDVLSALTLSEQALKGPNTDRRLLVTKLALSASGLTDSNVLELKSVINRLELITCLQNLVEKLCDCSFLYWHQVLLPTYFSKLVKRKANLSKLYILLGALSDCPEAGASTRECIKNDLLAPLNHLIETNLRVQTHLHLPLQPGDPFRSFPPRGFQKTKPALFCASYLSVKQEVESYLSMMFYNLITVVLHDWKTYGEMRRMAELQYGLETIPDNLPMQTLEQGLDVLEIMRNIHVFVGKYLYNLNNQVFVEEWSNNKHLNTINISHVANSIRTHGIGIMNTTVNFTYQFLRNKFFIFSQFMFDEHIKSRLLKDLRYFSEHKFQLNQMYPYERADKFNFAIKKLGIDPNGHSYLDLFRKLITYIGNAMGYVRLIRSGGRRCLADGTCFIPDLKAVDDLNEMLRSADLPPLTENTASCLRRDVNNLVDNFEEATEYFKLLVLVFAPAFRNPQNVHLRNFYVIVPPLTINFVEHSLMCKEKLNKRNRVGAAFTDDGFAMGLAYIVELLEQKSHLNSIHWFQSVKYKFSEDRKKISAQKAVASKEDEKLQQTLSLTEKRIHAFEKEFQLLYYNYSSARIFFQS